MTALGIAAARIVPVLLASSLNGSIVVLLALAAAAALRKAHPRSRHLLWLCAILAYPVVFSISMTGTLVDAARPTLATENSTLASVRVSWGEYRWHLLSRVGEWKRPRQACTRRRREQRWRPRRWQQKPRRGPGSR